MLLPKPRSPPPNPSFCVYLWVSSFGGVIKRLFRFFILLYFYLCMVVRIKSYSSSSHWWKQSEQWIRVRKQRQELHTRRHYSSAFPPNSGQLCLYRSRTRTHTYTLTQGLTAYPEASRSLTGFQAQMNTSDSWPRNTVALLAGISTSTSISIDSQWLSECTTKRKHMKREKRTFSF